MARIDLPDGRWVDVRPQYLSDVNRLVELGKRSDDPDFTVLDLINGYADIIRPAVLALSWDGDVTDMPEPRLAWLIRQWAVVTEDDALPPDSGTGGATPSPRPDSTRSRSSSRTRRSGSASAQ